MFGSDALITIIHDIFIDDRGELAMGKLLIWGTGNLAKKFIDNGYNGEIIGFIETNKSSDTYMGKPIYTITKLPGKYDYIIVANSYATEIYDLCRKLHIDISKMIFLYGIKEQRGCIDRSTLKEVLLEKNYARYCAEYGLLEDTFIVSDMNKYQRLNKRTSFAVHEKNKWPIICDKYESAGTISNYFWQDLWAARLIVKTGVKNHFDIGSRLDGFIAHLLAAGIEITMIDVREFPNRRVEGLHTIVDDATTLRQIPDESIGSISALCSLEHFGLGRYGDPVDPEACFTCFENIQRKLRRGGRLYLSVPVGRERVEFNAHRVFYASTIVNCFYSLRLEEFSCASEGEIEHDVSLRKYDNDMHNGEYRYGLFSFVKE